jgi:RNA recognition motif-containing protein
VLEAGWNPHVVSGDFEIRSSETAAMTLSRKQQHPMSSKLFVGNLSFDTKQSDLEQFFAGAGTVREAVVIQDRETGRSRGFAFVTMSTPEEARDAASKFNGKTLQGRPLKVNEAQERESTGSKPARRW